MSSYQVLFSKAATKELRQLSNQELQRVCAKSKELESNPRSVRVRN